MSIIIINVFNLPSNSSLERNCMDSPVGRYVVTAVSFTYVLFLLPFCVFVLYLGFQRWAPQRSVTSAATMTHSDFFTYNMALLELIGIFGCAFYYLSSYTCRTVMLTLGAYLWSFAWPAKTLFPILFCVEPYLAVVHPIAYRGLRQAGGVRIRNITTGCIWLSCFLWMGFIILLYTNYYRHVLSAFVVIFSLIVMVFCSLSVLRVLIRPQPGKVGRDRVQVKQSKQRAIRTILIIMGVLWLRFGGYTVTIFIKFSTQMSLRCVGEASSYVFLLPASVVLPVLFLQRAGKLPNCKQITG